MLDFVEFLESRYAERASPAGNAFTRFTEAVEDRLRAGRVSASAIAETMGLLNRAVKVLDGAVAAGKSVATDLVSAAQGAAVRSPAPAQPSTAPPTAALPQAPPPPPPPSSQSNQGPASGDQGSA